MDKKEQTVKKLTERKREDIIQAAKDEFRDNGFNATSMDRIAETANVSKRTVYNHFESKEVLFAAIGQQLCNAFSQVSEYPYESGKPLRAQLEAIAKKQMEMLCSERFLRLFKMVTSEALASPATMKSVVDNFQQENIGVVKWISAAHEDGKLRLNDAVMAGKQFLALMEAFTSWPYLYGEEHVLSEDEKSIVIKSAVNMFLGHYEARPR